MVHNPRPVREIYVERVKQKWIAFFEVETLFFCYCCCYYYCYCTVYFLGGVVALLLKTTKRERKKERKSAKRTKKRTKNETKTCRFFILFLVLFFGCFVKQGGGEKTMSLRYSQKFQISMKSWSWKISIFVFSQCAFWGWGSKGKHRRQKTMDLKSSLKSQVSMKSQSW